MLIRLNKRRAAHKAVGRDRAWLGLAAEDDITVMESPQPLVDHPLACDAVLTTLPPNSLRHCLNILVSQVWFGGSGEDGSSLVISGARRQHDILQSMVQCTV